MEQLKQVLGRVFAEGTSPALEHEVQEHLRRMEAHMQRAVAEANKKTAMADRLMRQSSQLDGLVYDLQRIDEQLNTLPVIHQNLTQVVTNVERITEQKAQKDARLISTMEHKSQEDAGLIAAMKGKAEKNAERISALEAESRIAADRIATMERRAQADADIIAKLEAKNQAYLVSMERERDEALAKLQAIQTAPRPTSSKQQPTVTLQPIAKFFNKLSLSFQDIPHTFMDTCAASRIYEVAQFCVEEGGAVHMRQFLQLGNPGWHCLFEICRKSDYFLTFGPAGSCSRHPKYPHVKVVVRGRRMLEFR
ncbi:hypothetical protein QQZ08_007254 [Neonectria magnoliae]|uniref:Uncharacterized protein n=1 Tax=Neonectria magnoliae TaxID=2732573 RepID=A0ABR1HY93_9HYPO